MGDGVHSSAYLVRPVVNEVTEENSWLWEREGGRKRRREGRRKRKREEDKCRRENGGGKLL